jgi:hypothetical protein
MWGTCGGRLPPFGVTAHLVRLPCTGPSPPGLGPSSLSPDCYGRPQLAASGARPPIRVDPPGAGRETCRPRGPGAQGGGHAPQRPRPRAVRDPEGPPDRPTRNGLMAPGPDLKRRCRVHRRGWAGLHASRRGLKRLTQEGLACDRAGNRPSPWGSRGKSKRSAIKTGLVKAASVQCALLLHCIIDQRRLKNLTDLNPTPCLVKTES